MPKLKPAVLCAFVLIGSVAGAPLRAAEEKKPASPRFVLICGAQMQQKTFAVDTAARTIDGKPARFSETRITWTTGVVEVRAKKGEKKKAEPKAGVNHELNRLDGTYRSWNAGETAENATLYSCDKAPPRKF